MGAENKRDRFRRLGMARGNRVLRDIEMLGNLSNKNNYTGHGVVEQIEQSSLYKHWRDDQVESIGDYEVWDFLEAMPYTDKTMLRGILKNYREAAELSGRQDVMKFLVWVSRQYRHVFQEGEARG